MVPSAYDPFLGVSGFNRSEKGVLLPDLLSPVLSISVLLNNHVIEHSDVAMESGKRSCKTSGEDSWISNSFLTSLRVVNAHLRVGPLLPLAFLRVDHLWPERPVAGRRQDVLNHLQLLLSKVAGRGDVQDTDSRVLGDLPSYPVGNHRRLLVVTGKQGQLVTLGIRPGPPRNQVFVNRSEDPVRGDQSNKCQQVGFCGFTKINLGNFSSRCWHI